MHSDKQKNESTSDRQVDPLCPHCGANLPQRDAGVRVAGPLPVAPAPAAGTPVCPNCGKPISLEG